MEFFAVLGGASAKIYDDIIDNNIPMNETVLESLKGIQWISLTAISLNDFNLTLVMYAFCILNWFANPDAFVIPYEISLLILYPFFFIWNFSTASFFSFKDIFCILIIIGSAVFEPVIHKFIHYTEGSAEKFLLRLSSAIITFAVLMIGKEIDISSSIITFIIYSLTYTTVSAIFQGYAFKNGLFVENT